MDVVQETVVINGKGTDVIEDCCRRKSLLLYELQQYAPKPIPVTCPYKTPESPAQYGHIFHGRISRDEVEKRLEGRDGSYLIRQSSSQIGVCCLSFVLSGKVRHFKIYYEEGEHWVGDTRFDSLNDLVADGLIVLYMEEHHANLYVERETKLTRRPAIYSRRRSIHAAKYEQCQIRKDSLSGLGRSNAVKVKSSRKSITEETESLNQAEKILSVDKSEEMAISLIDKKCDTYNYEKPHYFKERTFPGPTWCDVCGHFLWGFRSRGWRCKDCGVTCHKKCSALAESDCLPLPGLINTVYGIDLTTLLKIAGTEIPKHVKECVQAVESSGMDTEGIYRVSGSKDTVLAIKADFDSGLSLDTNEFQDIHAITGALKLYLRELPIPLITPECLTSLIDVNLSLRESGNLEDTLKHIKACLLRLPPSHRNVLHYILRHLLRVSNKKSKNQMSAKNLAIVFAPTLMKLTSSSEDGFKYIVKQQLIAEYLIEYVANIFMT